MAWLWWRRTHPSPGCCWWQLRGRQQLSMCVLNGGGGGGGACWGVGAGRGRVGWRGCCKQHCCHPRRRGAAAHSPPAPPTGACAPAACGTAGAAHAEPRLPAQEVASHATHAPWLQPCCTAWPRVQQAPVQAWQAASGAVAAAAAACCAAAVLMQGQAVGACTAAVPWPEAAAVV